MTDLNGLAYIEEELLKLHSAVEDIECDYCEINAKAMQVHFYTKDLAERAFTKAKEEGSTITFCHYTGEFAVEGGEFHIHLVKPNGVRYLYVHIGEELPAWANDAIDEDEKE